MTTALERTISDVRAKIHRARMSQFLSDRLSLNDTDCVCTQLVSPVLNALGWSVHDEEEVQLGFQFNGLDQGFGLGLFLSGAPCLLADLRGMGQAFNQTRVRRELLPRASDAGFEWMLLTDGDEYEVFNAHPDRRIDHRPFGAIRLSDDSMVEALEFFDLFARARMEENRLEAVWSRRQADRQVKQSFEELIVSDDTLVQLLLSKTKDLSANDIRSSLARATIVLEFESSGCSEFGCSSAIAEKLGRAVEMSEAELRVATWLQRRSIERWARGDTPIARSRSSQRRAQEHRRSSADRRSRTQDRRLVTAETDNDRRGHGERRTEDRRRDFERRVTSDRRRVRRRA